MSARSPICTDYSRCPERNGSSVKMSLNQQRESRVYEDLSTFERTLARFGDKVSLIAGLELSGKLSPEDAYQQIKHYTRI